MSDTTEIRSTSHFARFWSLWILCGSCVVGFAVFGHVWSALRFLGRWSCASTCPRCSMPMIARPLCGLSDLSASCKQVRRKFRTQHRAQMPMIARFCLLHHKQVRRKLPASLPTGSMRPLALCGLLKRFAHCPTSCYVPFRRHWGRPLQNGENDHG